MEPLKPKAVDTLLQSRPQVTPEDVEEYERLLSERFASDPDYAPAPDAEEEEQRESRLAELHQKLFGKQPVHRTSN